MQDTTFIPPSDVNIGQRDPTSSDTGDAGGGCGDAALTAGVLAPLGV